MQRKWLRACANLHVSGCAADSWAQVQRQILTSHKLMYPHAPVSRDSSIPRGYVDTWVKDAAVRNPIVPLQQEW